MADELKSRKMYVIPSNGILPIDVRVSGGSCSESYQLRARAINDGQNAYVDTPINVVDKYKTVCPPLDDTDVDNTYPEDTPKYPDGETQKYKIVSVDPCLEFKRDYTSKEIQLRPIECLVNANLSKEVITGFTCDSGGNPIAITTTLVLQIADGKIAAQSGWDVT